MSTTATTKTADDDSIEIVFSNDGPDRLQLIDDDPSARDDTNDTRHHHRPKSATRTTHEDILLNRAESIANRLAARVYRDIPPAHTDVDHVWTCDTTTDEYRRNRFVETQRLQRINRLLDLQQADGTTSFNR